MNACGTFDGGLDRNRVGDASDACFTFNGVTMSMDSKIESSSLDELELHSGVL